MPTCFNSEFSLGSAKERPGGGGRGAGREGGREGGREREREGGKGGVVRVSERDVIDRKRGREGERERGKGEYGSIAHRHSLFQLFC